MKYYSGSVTWKDPLERPKQRKMDMKFKICLRKIGWGGMEWINLALDKDQWRALVNTIMNIRVP
jgi:hypothetical protein